MNLITEGTCTVVGSIAGCSCGLKIGKKYLQPGGTP